MAARRIRPPLAGSARRRRAPALLLPLRRHDATTPAGSAAMTTSSTFCSSASPSAAPGGRHHVVWQFNFRGFDEVTDLHSSASIAMLRDHGMDFAALQEDGIDPPWPPPPACTRRRLPAYLCSCRSSASRAGAAWFSRDDVYAVLLRLR